MKLLLLIGTILIFCFCASAKTVYLNDYACLPDDAANDSSCVDDAVADLPNGGTVRVPEGVWQIHTQINLVQSNNYISLEFRGDKGAVFQLGAADNVTLFYAGNLNQLSFKNLIFLGTPGAEYDAAHLIFSTYVQQTLVEDNQFFGIRVKEHLLYMGITDAAIRGNQFEGNASKSNIYGANDMRSITVDNNTFIDYANYKNQFLTKTAPYGNDAWVWINRTLDTGNNGLSPFASIQNNRFDEGALYTIKAANLDSLDVTNAVVNVGISGGVHLSNVKRARITSSKFGYSTNPVPAVTALNGTTAILDNVMLGAAVFYYTKDGTSSVVIK